MIDLIICNEIIKEVIEFTDKIGTDKSCWYVGITNNIARKKKELENNKIFPKVEFFRSADSYSLENAIFIENKLHLTGLCILINEVIKVTGNSIDIKNIKEYLVIEDLKEYTTIIYYFKFMD